MVFIVFIGCTLKIGFIALMVLHIAASTARPSVCVKASLCDLVLQSEASTVLCSWGCSGNLRRTGFPPLLLTISGDCLNGATMVLRNSAVLQKGRALPTRWPSIRVQRVWFQCVLAASSQRCLRLRRWACRWVEG